MAKPGKAITVGSNSGRGCLFVLSGIFFTAGIATAVGVLMNEEYLYLFVPGILIFFGVAVLCFALTGKFRNAGASRVRKQVAAAEESVSRDPRELKAKGTPLGKFLLILAAALFWNGIVSVFVWQVVPKDWGGGGEDSVFLKLFLVPFVLIGVVLVYSAFHQFLALWNPRPRCKLDPGALRLGETGILEWSFSGNVRRIQKLVITLEGVESATYQQGTDTRTDTSTFAKIPIAEADDFRTIRLGQAEVAIPEFTAPTFTARRNKVIWTIKLEGDIPRWPDISESYEVEILPLELTEGYITDAEA